MVNINQDYTQFGIENYILKITGVFNYDNEFLKKATQSNYQEFQFPADFEKFSKDYFYPHLRNQFFNNDKKRHVILVRENAESSIVDLFSKNYDGSKSKQVKLKITESRVDLFDDGFGLFALNIKIQSEKVDLFKYSDAAFLTRNFETYIEHTHYEKWHEYIEKEVLLGSSTRGQAIKVDEYSGSKY